MVEEGRIERADPNLNKHLTWMYRGAIRAYGSVDLDAHRRLRDARKCADEVLKHLTGLGTKVAVRLEVMASGEDGVPGGVVRTVTESAKTMKLRPRAVESE